MPYHAIVFDLDGTLLDTLADLGACANHVLAREGFPTHETDAYRHFVGDGAAMLIQRVLPRERRDQETIGRCLDAFLTHYRQAGNTRVKPYEGIPELLDGLTRRGIRMSILSNKPHALTRQAVDQLLSEWEFDMVLGQRDAVPRKPDPAGALEIAESLGIPASGFFYLGDTAIDMNTAASAGMLPVGALWGFRDEEELLDGGAKMLIKRPQALLDFLDQPPGNRRFFFRRDGA